MITALVYLINSIVLAYFSLKTYFVIRKKRNLYRSYFLGTTSLYSLGLFIYSLLIFLHIESGNPDLLFFSDYMGRTFLYLGTAFAIQIPLYKIAAKYKYRYLASLVILLTALFMTTYNYYIRSKPYIDSFNVVHWQETGIVGIVFAIVILGTWIPTSIIFLKEYFLLKSNKALLLGLGFLVGSISGILQDFGSNTYQYIFINLLLAFGFLLIFWGLFSDEKKHI